ncbi:uncharacterized protein EAE97_006635 [Botrytis byssoidea]|uniref:Uncharacterized protein n=1 Tax=Botrytis byssoidea TaxID=139641 RepID=A0A9P5IR43_9HELO|nr:uncharacterized protein EAE97_006635 [Botrytis byssoidea]KAF7941798.1 hypothetical protein EAE97_006635 [Botrytis byssoidea]
MPSKQRTFELVDAPKVHRPMTSKQAKKAYQKANRTPRITKAEQKRRDAEELAKHRKAYEKEQAAAKAKAARDKKAAKALEQKEERKRQGIPEPSRHVRPSQSRISLFLKQGTKRFQETSNTGEESEGTVCDDLDDEPPAKRVAHDIFEEDEDEDEDEDKDENEYKVLSRQITRRNLEYKDETQKEHLANKKSDEDIVISRSPMLPEDSEDEFGDFPPLSENDISLLDTSSMHSTPVNANLGRARSAGLTRPPFHKPTTPFNDEQELPRMKNFEREQISPDDAFELENLLDSQIRSEAADAACKSDSKQAVSIDKEICRENIKSITPTSNRLVKDFAEERELLWHAPIHGRNKSISQSAHIRSPLRLPRASATKVTHEKQNSSHSRRVSHDRLQGPLSDMTGDKSSIPGTNTRRDSRPSNRNLPPAKKLLDVAPAMSKSATAIASESSISRITDLGQKASREGSVHSLVPKSHQVKPEPVQKPPVQAPVSNCYIRPALQEKSINMGPPALPQKSKLGTTLVPPVNTRKISDNYSLPPSTQAFLESHLDDFFPSATQEARELCEEPTAPLPFTGLEGNSAHQRREEKQGYSKDSVPTTADDEFGGILSTQELKMFSQDWEMSDSTPQKGNERENTVGSHKEISVGIEDLQRFICSQDSIFSSQELAGLENVSKPKSPMASPSRLSQAQVSILNHPQGRSARMQSQSAESSTPQIDPEMELTPKPKRSPWFKEKPEDKFSKKRFFTEKPEDLEAAALAESKKAWDEIKEATSSNRHNFDDDLEPEVDEQFKAALAESKEWDEVYKAVLPTPTQGKSSERSRYETDIEEAELQTPSRIIDMQKGASAIMNETQQFKRAASVASTDYGDGEVSDWDGVLDGL